MNTVRECTAVRRAAGVEMSTVRECMAARRAAGVGMNTMLCVYLSLSLSRRACSASCLIGSFARHVARCEAEWAKEGAKLPPHLRKVGRT